jgi:hypothetical protein
MRSSFKTRRASQKCKTSANYMTAVPGIKSFFGFTEKKFSARVSDATRKEARERRRNGARRAATETLEENCDSGDARLRRAAADGSEVRELRVPGDFPEEAVGVGEVAAKPEASLRLTNRAFERTGYRRSTRDVAAQAVHPAPGH